MRLREYLAPRDHYRVAVLGPRFSGKTTLINSWLEHPPPDLRIGRTFGQENPIEYVDLSVRVDGRRVTFDQVTDITGLESGLDLWANYIRNRHVVYMVDARALCGCLIWTDWYKESGGYTDARGPVRLSHDIGQILMQERHGVLTLSRAMVVTHTDQDCRRTGLRPDIPDREYATRIEYELRQYRSQLSTTARVPLIVAPGSLKHEAVARHVTTELLRHFGST